jgi:hypothetical protein
MLKAKSGKMTDLPVPKNNENDKIFHLRCMNDENMVINYPDFRIRESICRGIWSRVQGGG